MKLLEMEDVKVDFDDSSQTFQVFGAKEKVDSLIKTRPHWFRKNSPPNINSGGGGAAPGHTGTISPSDIYKAERLVKAGKLEKSKFNELYQRYVQQNRQA